MNIATSSKYHLILLAAIPVILVLCILFPALEPIVLRGSEQGLSPVQTGVFFSSFLAFKAILYWLTRKYRISKALCYFDIALVVGIIGMIIFDMSKPTISDEPNLVIILTIVIAVLIQLLLFVNFYLKLLMKTDQIEEVR